MGRKFGFGISLEDTGSGLLVRQYDEAYVARNWRLTPAVIELVETCLESKLNWMIRRDHPRRNSRWPNDRGVVYLAFSPAQDEHWSLAIDTWRSGRGDFDSAVFNGKYRTQFNDLGIPFRFEARNKGAGHLEVTRDRVIPIIRQLAGFDHSVLQMFRQQRDTSGYGTEYDIQRDLLVNWDRTPFSREGYEIVRDEYPVDGGLTSRRIDILCRHRLSRDWLVIELKRAEANEAAVAQVAGYLRSLGQKDDFSFDRVEGCLIAERLSERTVSSCAVEGIRAYEVSWPLSMCRRN